MPMVTSSIIWVFGELASVFGVEMRLSFCDEAFGVSPMINGEMLCWKGVKGEVPCIVS